MMRFVIVVFLGVLIYGLGSVYGKKLGLPSWLPAVIFAILGIFLQICYTHLLNTYFASVGMSDAVRSRLRSDAGVAPIWIVVVGFLAHALLLAGLLMPLLHAIGWIAII